MSWRADQSDADSVEQIRADLLGNDWLCGTHNDYRQGPGRLSSERVMTFWLFTHPSGLFVQGEARNDQAALLLCREQAQKKIDERVRDLRRPAVPYVDEPDPEGGAG